MRFLYVCADRGISPLGSKGASAHLRAVTAALGGRGHDVVLAVRRTDGDNAVTSQARLLRMPADEDEQADWLERIGGSACVDVVMERYSLSSGAAGVAAARLGVPLLLEVNAPLVDEAARFRGLEDVDTQRQREHRVLRSADHIVAVSDAVARHAVACGVSAARISVVPNGVDVERLGGGDRVGTRRRLGLAEAFVVGFCGSLKPWHGVRDLLAATASLPEPARLLVVGDGPERESLLRQADALALGTRVVLTGAVSEREVADLLAAMDVGVAPYSAVPDFYFSPLKILEYCAAGLPVVATAQGEMARLGPEALLVRPGAPEELAAALALLMSSAEPRTAMSEAASELAHSRTWGGVARRIEEIATTVRRPVRA